MKSISFDGCSLGVVTTKRLPIKKPWRIITTSKLLVSSLGSCRCPRNHVHGVCAGRETVRTGFYTEELAARIIDGLVGHHPFVSPKPDIRNIIKAAVANPRGEDRASTILADADRQIAKAVAKASAKLASLGHAGAKVTHNNRKHSNLHANDETVVKQLLAAQIHEVRKTQPSHRDKLEFLPTNVMGMVTKLLNKNDAEYHTPGAKEAINLDISKLITAGVWDEQPVSKRDAERMHSDATFPVSSEF